MSASSPQVSFHTFSLSKGDSEDGLDVHTLAQCVTLVPNYSLSRYDACNARTEGPFEWENEPFFRPGTCMHVMTAVFVAHRSRTKTHYLPVAGIPSTYGSGNPNRLGDCH